ncbi:MAG TPA: SCO family protein [Albitalea sp.]|nr:SCO family protein [Albitalea sp.]
MLQRRRLLIASALAGLGASVQAATSVYALNLHFTDDHGTPRELAEWQGRAVILTMGYGACRSICSSTLRTLEELQADADRRGVAIDVLVASIDPGEDTPQAWAQYRKARKLARTNWSFLTGSPGDTRRLARFLGLRYWRYDEHLMHDFRIVRLAADGSIAAALDWDQRDSNRLF